MKRCTITTLTIALVSLVIMLIATHVAQYMAYKEGLAASAESYTYIGTQNFGCYGNVVKGGQYIRDSSYPDWNFSLVLERNGSLKLIKGSNPSGVVMWSFESGLPDGNVEAQWDTGVTPNAFTIRHNGNIIWSKTGSDPGMGKGLILQQGQITLRTSGNDVIWDNGPPFPKDPAAAAAAARQEEEEERQAKARQEEEADKGMSNHTLPCMFCIRCMSELTSQLFLFFSCR